MGVLDRVRYAIRDYTDALDEDGDLYALFEQAQSLILTPLRIATSGTAIKAYLSALLFIATSLSLIGVSSTAYLLFYYNFIPQINLEQTIHLQYGPGVHPHATVPLQSQGLITQQQYDIEIVLQMPRTPTNLGAGNFMVDILLLNDPKLATAPPNSYKVRESSSSEPTKPPLHQSRRPAILPYTSYLTGFSYSILHLPSHLLRLRDLDSSTLVVPLFERLAFPRGRQNIPTHAYIEIQSQIPQTSPESCPPQGITISQGLHMIPSSPPEPLRTLQVYSAKLKFRARFRGLRYIVYNYRILSFLVFSTLFYFLAIISMGIAWGIISSSTTRNPNNNNNNNNKQQQKLKPIKQEDGGGGSSAKIKFEDENLRSDRSSDEAEQGALTDTSTTFPGIGRTVPPLRYPGTAQVGDNATLTTGTEPLQRDDGTNDAEGEDDDDDDYLEQDLVDVKEEHDDNERRFADSGIGTSMESEQPAPSLVRRRSGRGNREGR